MECLAAAGMKGNITGIDENFGVSLIQAAPLVARAHRHGRAGVYARAEPWRQRRNLVFHRGGPNGVHDESRRIESELEVAARSVAPLRPPAEVDHGCCGKRCTPGRADPERSGDGRDNTIRICSWTLRA